MKIELYSRVEARSVSIDNCTVPNLEVHAQQGPAKMPGETDEEVPPDTFAAVLDRRFGSEYVTREELDRWLPLIAHAQAIGTGYSCHGPDSRRVNPFGGAATPLPGSVDECNVPTDGIVSDAMRRDHARFMDGMERAWRLALGSHDYNGGYTGDQLVAFHHGIETVASVLRAVIAGERDFQIRAVEANGVREVESRTPTEQPTPRAIRVLELLAMPASVGFHPKELEELCWLARAMAEEEIKATAKR